MMDPAREKAQRAKMEEARIRDRYGSRLHWTVKHQVCSSCSQPCRQHLHVVHGTVAALPAS